MSFRPNKKFSRFSGKMLVRKSLSIILAFEKSRSTEAFDGEIDDK